MQISTLKSQQFWGNGQTDRIWVITHALNEEECIGRMIMSAKMLNPHKIIGGIDDRTTDKTEYIAKMLGAETFKFKWQHNFAYAKNLITKRVPKGDWCFVMGCDMQLQEKTVKPILKFVQDPQNVCAKFKIPEFHPLRNHKDEKIRKANKNIRVVTRPRTLLWRSHPLLYWEHLVHEEMVWSLYRMLEIGLDFRPDQKLPQLGDSQGILHYDTVVSTVEHRWWKRCYYLILWELNKIMHRYDLRDDEMLKAIQYVYDFTGYDRTAKAVDREIKFLLDKCLSGDLPVGLREAYDRERVCINNNREYD